MLEELIKKMNDAKNCEELFLIFAEFVFSGGDQVDNIMPDITDELTKIINEKNWTDEYYEYSNSDKAKEIMTLISYKPKDIYSCNVPNPKIRAALEKCFKMNLGEFEHEYHAEIISKIVRMIAYYINNITWVLSTYPDEEVSKDPDKDISAKFSMWYNMIVKISPIIGYYMGNITSLLISEENYNCEDYNNIIDNLIDEFKVFKGINTQFDKLLEFEKYRIDVEKCPTFNDFINLQNMSYVTYSAKMNQPILIHVPGFINELKEITEMIEHEKYDEDKLHKVSYGMFQNFKVKYNSSSLKNEKSLILILKEWRRMIDPLKQLVDAVSTNITNHFNAKLHILLILSNCLDMGFSIEKYVNVFNNNELVRSYNVYMRSINVLMNMIKMS